MALRELDGIYQDNSLVTGKSLQETQTANAGLRAYDPGREGAVG
jgi:hypothetical protein